MIPKLYKVISGKYVDDTLTYLLTHQGGGVTVNTFTQDIVLTGNTIPLDTGFYNTGNYGLFIGSQTPQNLIFGTGEIIYVDKDTLTIIGSLVSIAYDLIDSVWTIQDNQKIENEITNNRDKIPTSQAVYNGLATKQNTLTAGSGISIVGNVISSTGGGGGVTVTNLTQDIILSAGSSTTSLSTGFYNTNGYGVYYHSATISNLIYGNGIFYYDDTELTFIDSYNITNYSVGDSDWVVTNNASVESTLTNSTIHVPNSYAVYNKINEVKLISCTIADASSTTIDVTGWTPIKLPLTTEKINIGNCFTLSNNEITVGSGVSLVRLELNECHWAKNTDLMVAVYVNDTIIGPTIYTRDKETSPTSGTGQVMTFGSVIAYANVQEGDKIKLCVRGNAQGNTKFNDDTGLNVVAISETSTI